MRWLQLEYIAKGVFLGLLLFTALQQPGKGDIELLILALASGLGAGLALAAVGTLRQGYKVKGRLAAFVLFLILENPFVAYAGILGGMVLAAYLVPRTLDEAWLLPACLAGGVVLGLAFPLVRLVKAAWVRSMLSVVLPLALVGVVLAWLHFGPNSLVNSDGAGIFILLGLPLFYLLSFGGRAEETEVETGALCSLLFLGLWLWHPIPNMRTLALLFPALLYWVYTVRFLPKVRVFKHAMRGLSYADAGRHRLALITFRRALELDPQHKLAREGLWAVHRDLDLGKAARDPDLVTLVDPGLCLKRAGSLLIEARPSAEQLKEAHHLLDFVLQQRPPQRPTVLYWRCVAHLKTGEVEQAAEELTGVLDPSGYSPGDRDRELILLQAWQLALQLHPEMQRRVGGPQLAQPGRRMDAIGVVERRLAEKAENPTAWDLKRLLYANLTEEEYNSVSPGVATPGLADFDHAYVQQLGLALLQDSGRWQRGAEYLRIAARGLPGQGPSIFAQVAQAAQKAGDPKACRYYYQMAQHMGRTVGAKNLGEEEKQAYFTAVKLLAEDAVAREDFDAALDSYHLYAESERSGVETLRTLANLYEQKAARDKDQVSVLNALRMTEQALLYDGSDKDLLGKKDRYYNDLQPETLQPRREAIQKWFDVAYCLRKARSILDSKTDDLEMLDWALRLAVVAHAVKPDSVSAQVAEARAKLRKGERDPALVILEDLREAAPKSFASDEDSDAWYLANRILGDLYMNELARPDLAISCYLEFKKSPKSGADTLYKLGQAHEACGELKKAARFYEQVTAYEGHPLAYEARQALYRVKDGEGSTA